MSSASSDFSNVLKSLLPPSCHHHFLSLPVSPRNPHISSHQISLLSLHPVVESVLHILNMDLPSAHFLLRHMQAAPAWEAMFLHGVLHRIEGDMDNARAWYADVKDSEVFRWVWSRVVEDTASHSPKDDDANRLSAEEAFRKAMSFLDQVEACKASSLPSNSGSNGQAPKRELPNGDDQVDISLREIRLALSFCEKKFGTSPVSDASVLWVSMNEEHAVKAAQMITGGEGWREF